MFWKKRGNSKQPPVSAPRALDAPAEPAFLAPIISSATLRSSLGADTSVSGRLSFTAPTRLDGRLRGEVHASDLLVIGETGIVDGIVRGSNVVVLGSIDGEVFATERVEIGASGRLKGSIETRELVVQEGGKLDGSCRIAPSKANIVLLRPRTGAEDELDFQGNAAATHGSHE
jgi:cytoskeletal protein CcmA (bactofilin family)